MAISPSRDTFLSTIINRPCYRFRYLSLGLLVLLLQFYAACCKYAERKLDDLIWHWEWMIKATIQWIPLWYLTQFCGSRWKTTEQTATQLDAHFSESEERWGQEGATQDTHLNFTWDRSVSQSPRLTLGCVLEGLYHLTLNSPYLRPSTCSLRWLQTCPMSGSAGHPLAQKDSSLSGNAVLSQSMHMFPYHQEMDTGWHYPQSWLKPCLTHKKTNSTVSSSLTTWPPKCLYHSY